MLLPPIFFSLVCAIIIIIECTHFSPMELDSEKEIIDVQEHH